MFQEIYITEITTSELLVCRGCLATDIKLYNMRQNRLMDAYSTLLTSTVPVTDDLPHYLCSYCAALLLKCDAFRNKCMNAQVLLKDAILSNLELTLENIKQIDRPAYFRQSYTQTIDIDDTNSTSNNNDNITESVKEEFDDGNVIDHFNNDSIDNINNHVEPIKEPPENDKNVIINTRSTIKRNLISKISKKRAKLKHEDLQSDSQPDIVKNEDMLVNNKLSENSIETNKNNSVVEDDITIADLKNNSKYSAKATNKVSKKKVTKKNIPKAKNQIKKSENVSKMYNMEELNLSKEEQLKEIEDRKHSEIYLQADFKCSFCYKGFRLKQTYDTHMMLHDDRSGKLVCDICNCHFQTKRVLCKHKATHKKRFTCKHDSCKYVTKHLSQAREHFKWHGGVKHTCKHCGKECSGQTSYYHHLKLYHPTSDDLIRCEICGTSCSGPIGFTMHEKRMHKEMFSPECLCTVCGTQFYCSDALKAHRDAGGACSPRAKYCVRCGGAFHTQLQLEEHEAEQRKPRTTFKCDVCKKDFEGYTSLKRHQLRHEMTLTRTYVRRQLVCEICGKVLSNRHILNQHYLNKHSSENPFKCTDCPKSFKCLVNLKLHTRIHTGERPYACPHCTSTFRTVANLRRHELVHTDARPHTCEICSKAFKTKADCKAHVQTVHMKIYRPRVRRKYKKTE